MWRKRISALAVATALAVVGAAPSAWAGGQGDPLYGDLNGDGVVDRAVLAGGGADECGVQVSLGDGAGGYGAPTTYTYDTPGEYGYCPDMGVVVDLGGDGTVELVLAWFDGRPPGVETDLLVLRDYQPAGGFDAIYQPSYIGLADFNGDGRQDVYQWTDQGDGFLTFLNTASGQLVRGPIEWCSGWPAYEFADFNRNGATDVLIAYFEGCGENFTGVVVLLDNGTAVELEGDPWGDSYWAATVVDANADGIPDVRTTNESTGEVTHFIGNGRGGFGAAPLADDDTASTKGTKKVDIPVLANDLYTSATKITIVTPPKYGKLQITSRRTVLYTPNGQHTQSDKFVYRLTADGKTDIAGVTVRVKS
ncbi:hypothetical protein BDK92_2364 [Micromonospora pisi]|uniref:VCBS repeat protein n=1 Tax=Micromonospora pisi TaxID=589240 RepID=A0A495JJ79_9ACTN|nr:FG-GAP-like repeat-containing protein [Micromonospora pisi]RKR88059.1 hypothetical protein BDK92_2364 [Micromonospora pisi]